MTATVIHPTYLPFTEQQLLGHFAQVSGPADPEKAERHLAYYRQSVQRLAEFETGPAPTGKDARSLTRRARQIEKDERFWVAAALMGVFHSRDRVGNLAALLTDALWPTPPVEGLTTWKDC